MAEGKRTARSSRAGPTSRASSASKKASSRRGASSSSGDRGNGSPRSKLPAAEAIRRVREDLPALLGSPVESILGVERHDGEWKISAQIVELARIPNSTDVLGVYTVTLDSDGELAGYQRERRYTRGQVIED
jgi:Gas vesicle synthesis protein GvpO